MKMKIGEFKNLQKARLFFTRSLILKSFFQNVGRRREFFIRRFAPIKSGFEKHQRLLRRILIIISLVYVSGLALIVTHTLALDQGFPQGKEVLQDIAMVSFVKDHSLPRSEISLRETSWNPYWDNGQSFFFGGAGQTLYWVALGVLGRLAVFAGASASQGGSSEALVRIASVVSILLIVGTLFGITYLFSRRILLAMTVPLLLLASPVFWAYIIDYGFHGRLFSFMLFTLFVYVLFAYCSSGGRLRRPKSRTDKVILAKARISIPDLVGDYIASRLGSLRSLTRRINYHFFFLVFLLVTLFLSDFTLSILSIIVFGFLCLVFSKKGEQVVPIKSGLWFFGKTVGIALGLSAFYLVPHFAKASRGEPFFVDLPGIPAMFDVLFKQAYPGPHVLILPLVGLFLLAVFIVRPTPGVMTNATPGVSSRLRNTFYLFAGLTIFFILYGLGKIPFLASDTSIHTIYIVTLFAVISIAVGCSYLGKEAVSGKILLVAVAALTAISLRNTATLNQKRFQHPTMPDAPIDKGMFDMTKKYRVYYPAGRQSEQLLLYKKYDLFFTSFQPSPGRSRQASPYAPFLFDWFAVREAYIYKDREDGSGQQVNPAFNNEHFEKHGDYAIYKRATPIVYAINSQPVLFYAKDDKTYNNQLNGLASQKLGLEKVIPIRSGGARSRSARTNKSSIPIISSVKELEKVCRKCFAHPAKRDEGSQEMVYKSPTRWEISLGKQYKGVVFKQTFSKNWQAVLEIPSPQPSPTRGEGKIPSPSMGEGKDEGEWEKAKLPIFEAGPNMMYVFLPKYDTPVKVIFTYQQSLSEKAGIAITIGTVLMLPMYRFKKKLLYGYIAKLQQQFKSKKF